MFTVKGKLIILKFAKQLLKEDALAEAYGDLRILSGICGYLFRSAKELDINEYLVHCIMRDLAKLRPEDKRISQYWWPCTLKYVPVRREILNKLIEYYSLPWYKRLFTTLKK